MQTFIDYFTCFVVNEKYENDTFLQAVINNHLTVVVDQLLWRMKMLRATVQF
jgi:hypothetical protein